MVLLGFEVPLAATPRSRLLGLAFLDLEVAPAGLLLPRCRSIHSFGMRFSLDVVFLDRDGNPLDVVEDLAPRRFAFCRHAASVLELKGGTFCSRGVDGSASAIETEGARYV